MPDISDIKVAILAAGLGTRLRPLTDTIPKVMIPIHGDHPLIEHTILLLKKQRFRKFILNLHYLPEKVETFFGDGSTFGVEIEYSKEEGQLLETAGAIKKMEPLLTDPFLLLYGDQLHFFDFRPVLEAHTKNNALATIVLKRSDLPQNGDLAEIDSATGRITHWHQRPHDITEFRDGLYLSTGMYVFSKQILGHIPEGKPVKLDIDIIPPLVSGGEKIFGFVCDDDILDVGTPEKYEYAKEWYGKRIGQSPFAA